MRTLNSDISTAYRAYSVIFGEVVNAHEGEDLIVGIYEHIEGELVLGQVKYPDKNNAFYSVVEKGKYALFGFEDANKDRVYQPGERAFIEAAPRLNSLSEEISKGDYDSIFDVTELVLDESLVLPIQLDLSLESARQQIQWAKTNLLAVTTLEDERFSDENTRLGTWEPVRFRREIGYGLYILQEIDTSRKPVVFVHGINDSPRTFATVVANLDPDYQPVFFHYPSSLSLDYSADVFANGLRLIGHNYPEIESVSVIAHSMGGLVSMMALDSLNADERSRVDTLVTISTPWHGHRAAASGVKWSPVVAPVWFSMSPDSAYIATLASSTVAETVSHHMLVSVSQSLNGEGAASDGVVTVASQLYQPVQQDATALYALADTHSGILLNSCAIAILNGALQNSAVRSRLTVSGCEHSDD